MDPTDINLKKQFLEAYNTHADALFRYGLFRLDNRELATDLVQDTFTKTWDYIAKGHHIDNMRAFLYRSMKNAVIDHYRARKPVSSIETMAEEDGFDPPAPEESIADQIDGEKAIAMLSKLPEDYREAVFLRYVDGLSIGEIAEVIDVSRTLVAVRVHRGLAKLRELYINEGVNEVAVERKNSKKHEKT